jgi:peptide/nickel transport system permease protein
MRQPRLLWRITVKQKRIVKTLLESIVILFSIVTLNFMLIRFMPGDAVMHIIGEDDYLRLSATAPQVIEDIRTAYGLDQPITHQYIIYLGKVMRLDFGSSYRTKTPVLETVLFRMRWTLFLAVPATLIAAIFGGTLGLLAANKRGGIFDISFSGIMLLLLSVPTNCTAILFLVFFAFRLGWFPIGGITSGGLAGITKFFDVLHHMVLPLGVLVLMKTPSDFMLMKSTVYSLEGEEYLDVARSKGLTRIQVLFRHALKNALVPFFTSVFMQFGQILAGSMMVEVVFSWKGMGTLLYDSVLTKDFPVLQTCILFIGVCVVACNLLSDALGMAIDPRTKELVHHE